MTNVTSRRELLLKLPVISAGMVVPVSALAEPSPGKVRYAMVIDLRRCIGCQACTVSCHLENRVPAGEHRTTVSITSVSVDSRKDPSVVQLPRLCNHCDNPVCIARCPVGATYKLPEGIVVVDSEKCIGCGACVALCPYKARFINSETKKADKCTFCINRVKAGLLPACVETCAGGARIFGDINDASSLISKTLREAKSAGVPVHVLMPEQQTGPNVYYIGLGDLQSAPSNIRLNY